MTSSDVDQPVLKQSGRSETGELHCSFCTKSQHDVKKLVAGPAMVFICDECIALCAEIVREDRASAEEGTPTVN